MQFDHPKNNPKRTYSALSVALAGLLILPFCPVALAANAESAKPLVSVNASKPVKPSMSELIKASASTDWRPLNPENTLYMEFEKGRVVIELAPDFAPQHASNIKALVREGYFDGLAVIRSQDNYVAQWGAPEEDDEKGQAGAKKLSLS